MANVAGIILAGGKSSRMGKDKSKLNYRGKTLLEHMQMIVKDTDVAQVYISNEENIADEIRGKGPLGGVHASLKALHDKHTYLLFIPVDMPSLKPTLLAQLISAPAKHDVVRFGDYILPFRLKVSASQIDLIEEILESEDYSLKGFQQKLMLHKLPAKSSDFININTAEEWHEFTN